MMIRILVLITMSLLCCTAKAQQGAIYLDSKMRQVNKRSKAAEYAVIQQEENGIKLVSFYSLDGKLLRNSNYRQFGKKPEKNVLHGATSYKFSNSDQDSLLVFYPDNKRNGGAFFYYPTGKIMANCQYKDGKLNGLSKQYYEDGKTKRTEIYENDLCKAGKYFAPDSTLLAFTPFYKGAEYADGEAAMFQLISKNCRPAISLLKDMNEKSIDCVNATFEIIVNTDGKAVDFILLSTEHPDFNENCFPDMLEILNRKGFLPGEMDGKRITTAVATKEPIACGFCVTERTTRITKF